MSHPADLILPASEERLRIISELVSHDIEEPEQRRTEGKPAIGRVSVSVITWDDHVLAIVQDDGAERTAFSFEIGNQPQNSTIIVEVAATSGALSAVGRDSLSR